MNDLPPFSRYTQLPNGFRDDVETASLDAFNALYEEIDISALTGEPRASGVETTVSSTVSSDLGSMRIEIAVKVTVFPDEEEEPS